MTRTSLDDAQWTSLMLVIQQIPHAWKRDEAAVRRFIEAVLWILRTGAPWRDLPETLGHWPSVYHRWRRWCVRGWCNLIFEHLRPMVPADGLVLADSTTCKAHRSAAGAAHSSQRLNRLAARAAGSAPRSTPAPTASAASCASLTVPGTTPTCAMSVRFWRVFQPRMPHSTVAMSRPNCGPIWQHRDAPSIPRPSRGCSIRPRGTRRSTPNATTSRTPSPASRTPPGSRFAATKRAAVGWALPTWPLP